MSAEQVADDKCKVTFDLKLCLGFVEQTISAARFVAKESPYSLGKMYALMPPQLAADADIIATLKEADVLLAEAGAAPAAITIVGEIITPGQEMPQSRIGVFAPLATKVLLTVNADGIISPALF